MIKYFLPPPALNVIDRYWHLRAGENTSVRCPYFRNPRGGRERWGLTAYSGKGSPKEIEDELQIIEKLEGVVFSKMQESQIRDIMRKRKLGVECSGFITRILDAWTRDTYGKPIYSVIKFNASGLGWIYSKLRPYTHINVGTLADPRNAREIQNFNEIMPGDFIRFNTSIDHAVLVTSVERGDNHEAQKIHYTHSVLEENGEGVKNGTIKILNPTENNLISQKWSEEPETGHVISEKGTPKIYRLFIFDSFNFPKGKNLHL